MVGGLRRWLSLPGVLLAVLVGVALAWSTGLIKIDPAACQSNVSQVGQHLAVPPAWGTLGGSPAAAALAGGHDSDGTVQCAGLAQEAGERRIHR